MGPYKPLRTWVDEFIPYYMGNVMEVDRPDGTPCIVKISPIFLGALGGSFWGTLPETNIAPENRPLEKEIPIANHHF